MSIRNCIENVLVRGKTFSKNSLELYERIFKLEKKFSIQLSQHKYYTHRFV